LNTHRKEDIFKNAGNQTVDGSHWLPSIFFSYDGKSTFLLYLMLCSTEERNSYSLEPLEVDRWLNLYFRV